LQRKCKIATGPPDLRARLEQTARRLTSPELIAEVARMLYLATGDAHTAAAIVSQQRARLHLAQKEIADALIELARAARQWRS
jgi:hypothetical protein